MGEQVEDCYIRRTTDRRFSLSPSERERAGMRGSSFGIAQAYALVAPRNEKSLRSTVAAHFHHPQKTHYQPAFTEAHQPQHTCSTPAAHLKMQFQPVFTEHLSPSPLFGHVHIHILSIAKPRRSPSKRFATCRLFAVICRLFSFTPSK